ncbi:hypothetical protein [uncultured Ilyobacter sp.]|uniref:hypothetical protein n=1 Tax=uncultured Ilyobacter sp. TaxID=544433 RepID=UPI0029C84A3A|nr:hypothetical protein [uncultured Ilyobacter sp.]
MKCKYGDLEGVYYSENYDAGELKSCILQKKNILKTEYGLLTPQYKDDSERRKLKFSLEFYKNGIMKKVYLQEKVLLETEAGIIPAESVMFYENGSIKKIFPLDGKLTGFWTEQHEFKLAEKLKIKTPVGIMGNKIISISFYKSGKIKSLTLWPIERPVIKTPIGEATLRTGISFYETGGIKSFEPAEMLEVETPIGSLKAYDIAPLGIHGDNNSLSFYENGKIKSLYTITNEILIKGNCEEYLCSPAETISMCSDEKKDLLPMKIEFKKGKVFLENRKASFNIEEFAFKVNDYKVDKDKMCSTCC